MTPTIALVAFEDWGRDKVFVKDPNLRGRYLLTDRSVAVVQCEQCGATVGEPCFRMWDGVRKYSSSTHIARRAWARDERRHNPKTRAQLRSGRVK